MSVPLLQTKLYAPPVRAQLIHRPALTARFSAEEPRPLTIVAAPAGFGKTTLVSQWLAQADQLAAWLSLDDDDNDPARFLTYLIAALQTRQPALGARVLELLAAPQPPPLKALLTWLLDELGTLTTPLTLILDDYHVISAQPIHEALAFFIDHVPPTIHLVITSRIDPPLPLARWRVRNLLAEIRTDDLRFTADETDLFLNHLSGLNLTAQQIANLEAKTEGWVAGLQLAALSLHGRREVDSFIAAFTGTYRYILEYMTEEVLHQQPESVQSFLLQTAILERLTGSLCDAVLGRADGETMLEQLAHANLFLIPLDDQGYWYRYHHLFVDLLRHYLNRTASPFADVLARELKGDVSQLHRRAAAWYEATGVAEDAIHHALAAQDFVWAGSLILGHAEARLAQGEVTLLLCWLQALPEAWLRSQLQLQLLEAGLLFLTGQFDEVQQRLPHIEQARNLYQRQAAEPQALFSQEEIPGLIAALQAEIALFQGEIPRALPLFQQALAHLDRDMLGLRSVMGHHFALYYWPQSAVEQGTVLAAEFGAARAQPDALNTLIALGQQAGLKRRQGQCQQSMALLRHILHMAAESATRGSLPIVGLAHGELSLLLYEANELAAAEAHARQGIELGTQGTGMSGLFASYVGVAIVKTAQQRFAEASDAIDQIEQLARRVGSGPFLSVAAVLRMKVSLIQGDLAAAVQWQQASGLRVDDEFDSSMALIYRDLGRMLIAQGQLDAATTLLARLVSFFEADHWTEGLIRTLPIQAVALQAQGQLEPALVRLQRALTLAEPEGYIRSFVDLGEPMVALLRQAVARGLAPNYISRLLAAFHRTESSGLRTERKDSADSVLSPQSSALLEPLTPRELEVLRLIAAGHSNREIARTLIVSLGTVKKHLSNIFGKLATTSRTQAIARARELHLL